MTNPDSTIPAPPDGFRWQAVPELSDEFNAPELELSKWLDHHPYWEGRIPSQFKPENVSQTGGYLRLESTTEIYDMAEVGDPENEVWVQSACVTSREPIASYGYYEARIKASDLSMTSSFWFQGEYSEIDVIEQLGAPKTQPWKHNLMLTNTHYYPDGWEADIKTPHEIQIPSGSAEEFHVYGLWWVDKDNALFYHNGELVAEIRLGGEFLEPMYMFFDTEVFTWEGLPNIADLKNEEKNTILVDWVRAWRLVKD